MTNPAVPFLPVDMTGMRVVITAAGGGIGAVMADAFAERGAKVCISDIDAGALAGSRHPGYLANMGQPDQVQNFMQAALAHLGGLDVLINNAGIAGPVAPVEHISAEQLDEVLDVNLASQFHCVRLAVAALRKSGRASIINMSSSAGKFGFSLRTPYAASKWGVIGLTRSLAIELGPEQIRVNALLPGAVEGPRARSIIAAKAAEAGVELEAYTQQALGRVSLRCMVPPQDIANMALYLASPFGARITGQAISVDAGKESLN